MFLHLVFLYDYGKIIHTVTGPETISVQLAALLYPP